MSTECVRLGKLDDGTEENDDDDDNGIEMYSPRGRACTYTCIHCVTVAVALEPVDPIQWHTRYD